MIIPCDLVLKKCLPCNDDPIQNITAEAPDVNVFIGFRDFKWNPPLGVTYFQLGCKAVCFSTVSQEAANLCAQQQAQDCVWIGGEDPVVPPVPPGPDSPGGKGGGPSLPPQEPRNPIRTYRNSAQSCTAVCPDGSPYVETVPSGIVTALSQVLADAKARSLACRMAQRNLFCISGDSPPSVCVGSSYFFQLGTSNGADLIWTIDGNLPPGLNFDPFDATITGTPLSGGSFTFVVEVSDSLGRFQVRVLSICVMEIVTPETLPQGEIGLVYAVPLIQQPATVSSEEWTLVSGSLPPGIELASNGSLTGIPTENGSSEFTLMVEATCDGSAVSCQKAFTLEVGEGCGIFDITWGVPNRIPFSWTQTEELTACNFVIIMTRDFYVNDQTFINGQGSFMYTGPAVTGHLHLELTTINFPAAFVESDCRVIVSVDAVEVLNILVQANGSIPAPSDYDFNIPVSVDSEIICYYECFASNDVNVIGTASVIWSGTYSMGTPP